MNIITLLVLIVLLVATVSVAYYSYKTEGSKVMKTYIIFMCVVGWFAVITTISEMVL